MKKSTTWIFFGFLSNILLTSAHKLSAPYFECGPHGRFEYCVDGIPGCIVGCHCHPGYYFDTETKVCEPNTKLRQDYRRQFMREPTPTTTPFTANELSPTPTTSNLIDKNVDDIAKDADDLGDWLYNQFFKTIENQVINKTTEEKGPTRRSGSDSTASSTSKPLRQPTLKVQRRNRRRHGKRSSKKKLSKKGLRRKLLRISEDDSLFDSSSDTDSDSSDSSPSSSDSSDSDEPLFSKERRGGRKILMINKRPPVPLPSFVFMPNMETPYFPPLGLPAPPPAAIPMYPMIPVPPVIPIQMPSSSTTEAATTNPPHTTEAPHTTENHKTTGSPTEKPDGDEKGDEKGDEEKNNEAEKPEDPARSRSSRKFRGGKGIRKSNQRGTLNRDRIIKRVQEKMRARNQMPPQHFPHELFDQYFDHNYPDLDRNMHSDLEFNDHPEAINEETNFHAEDMPHNQNVNFKYLSELIHKLNNSDFKTPSQPQPMHLLRPTSNPNLHPNLNSNPHPNLNPHLNPNQRPNPNPLPNPRPNENPHPNENSHANLNPSSIPIPNPNINSNPYPQRINLLPEVKNKPFRRSGKDAPIVNYTVKNDYADLGRQIAALVRKIDAKGDREIDVDFEGEKTMTNIPPQAMFNNNGFSSRSYWERFARSPFNIRFSDDNFIHIGSSEQLQLQQLSLEDQINIAATTPRTLTLSELENIISVIQKIKSVHEKRIHGEKPKTPTKLSLMTPLLKIQPIIPDKNKEKFDLKPKNPNAIKSFQVNRPQAITHNKTQPKFQPITLGKLIPRVKKLGESSENSHPVKLNLTPPKTYIPNGPMKVPKTHTHNHLNNIAPQRFKIPLSRLLQYAAIQPMSARLQNKNLQQLKPDNYQQGMQHLHMDNHKYWDTNKGIYHHYENIIKGPSFTENKNKPASYFHHQVHHFDLFD